MQFCMSYAHRGFDSGDGSKLGDSEVTPISSSGFSLETTGTDMQLQVWQESLRHFPVLRSCKRDMGLWSKLGGRNRSHGFGIDC